MKTKKLKMPPNKFIRVLRPNGDIINVKTATELKDIIEQDSISNILNYSDMLQN